WRTARDPKEKKFEEYYRRYRCIEDAADKTRPSERSTIKMPATKQAIDSAYDHIMQSIFGPDPFFDIQGRQNVDKIPAEIFKEYLRCLFFKENFARKTGFSIKELLIYGTCVGRVAVDTARETRVILEDQTEDEGYLDDLGELQERQIITGQNAIMEYHDVNRPEYQPVSVMNFFPDPMAADCCSGEGVFVRAFPSIQKLRAMARHGVIDGKGVKLLEKEGAPSSTDRDAFKRQLAMTGIQVEQEDWDKNPMTLEYWGWLEKDELKAAGYKEEIEDGGAEVSAIISGGSTTLKLIGNPFVTRKRPFMKSCYEEIPDEFWGMGIPEATEGPARALDATIRSRLDNKALSVNTMWAINTRRMIPGQNLSLYPGKTWLTNGPVREAIEQFKV
ncbi:hypothetical protein LCGC14_2892490, partial [marine sediment metagenome]